MVYINDLYNNMIETDGVFIPFIPAISRGMLPDREIPNTSILVLDRLAMSQLKLSANAKVLYKTTNENLYLVEIPHEERWLESIVGGVVESTLTKGTPAYIRLFGGETSSVQKVSVDIELLAESEIIIQLDQQKYLFTLPACRDIYEIELPSPAQYVIISCADSDINFYGYSLE